MTEQTLAAAEQDFDFVQGEDWRAIFQLWANAAKTIPFDATGCEIDMHIREGVADSGASIVVAASTRATGDGAGKITWLSYASDNTVDEESSGDPADGVFRVWFTATDTQLLTPSKKPRKGGHETATFVYDIEVSYSDGAVKRFMQGTITVDLEVTRRG